MPKALQVTLLAVGLSLPMAAHAQTAGPGNDRPSGLDMVIAGGVVGGLVGKVYATGVAATASSIGSGISSGLTSLTTTIGDTAVAVTTASPPVIVGVILGGAAAYVIYRQMQ